ncbi:MAG: glycosyltransferase [Solirubrobacterales bacterium]
MADRADLAIVIVSMNDSCWLRPCLRTVFEHAGGIDLEVFVVENGETEETAALIEEEFPTVALIDSENRGFAHANNLAVRSCSARHVLFLNPDTELVDGDLAELVAIMDRSPEIGLIGVRHLTRGEVYPSIRRFPSAARAFGAALGSERWPLQPRWACERVLDSRAYDRATDCDWTVGAFMLARGEALQAVGLMDERFFLYSEETDLCLRIKQAGWRVRHLPAATIIHHAGKAGVNARMEAQNAYARMQHAAKHFSPARREAYRMALLLNHGIRWGRAAARSDGAARRAAGAALAAVAGIGAPPFRVPPQVAVAPARCMKTDKEMELTAA